MRDVVFVTVADPSRLSGGGTATKGIVEAFSNHHNNRVTLICPQPSNEMPSSITNNVKRIKHLSKKTNPGDLTYHFSQQTTLFRILFQTMLQVNPDVLISRMSKSMISPPIIAKIFNIPYVTLTRGWLNTTNDVDGRYQSQVSELRWYDLKDLMILLNYKLNYSISSQTYVPVQGIEDEIREFSSTIPVHVFPNAVNPEQFQSAPKKQSRRELSNGIDPDDFVVGFVGSFREVHKVPELIHGFSNTIGSEPDAKLMLIGEAKSESREKFINELISNSGVKDKIIRTGKVRHDKIPQYISACDVMYGAIDKDHPATPLKVSEYLACERPAIVADQREFSFIEDQNCGYIVDPVTADEVGEAINYYYNLPEASRKDAGNRGRRYVKEHHTWENLPELVEKHLGRVDA